MPLQKPTQLEPLYEQSSTNLACLVQRVSGVTRIPVVKATLASITLKVFDATDMSEPIAEETLTIADVIFDTLQPWPQDAVGYNCLIVTDPAWLPAGGRNYHFELLFTPVSGLGHPIPETFIVPTIGRAAV